MLVIVVDSNTMKPPSNSAPISDLLALDPLDFADEPDGIVSQRGIVIRTDFQDDAKWEAFCNALLKSERDGVAELMAAQSEPEQRPVESAPDENDDDDDESSSEEEEEDQQNLVSMDVDPPPPHGSASDAHPSLAKDPDDPTEVSDAFIIIDPSKWSAAPAVLKNNISTATNSQPGGVSNLTLLRLFNDVNIIPCRPVPQGRKRVKGSLGQSPSARLVDSHGFHEVYSGRLIWVYDGRSNTDGSARLITQRPTYYGLAT